MQRSTKWPHVWRVDSCALRSLEASMPSFPLPSICEGSGMERRKLPRAHSKLLRELGQTLLPRPHAPLTQQQAPTPQTACGFCHNSHVHTFCAWPSPEHLASSWKPSLGEMPFLWANPAPSRVEWPRAAPEAWFSKGGAISCTFAAKWSRVHLWNQVPGFKSPI